MTRSFYRMDVATVNGIQAGTVEATLAGAVEIHRNSSSVYFHCARATRPDLEAVGAVYHGATWLEFWDSVTASVREATIVVIAERGGESIYARLDTLAPTDLITVGRGDELVTIPEADRLATDQPQSMAPHRWVGD